MNVIEYRHAPGLGGRLRHMRNPTQRNWDTVLKSIEGLPLDADELTWWQAHTGRTVPRVGGFPEAAIIVGRQAGKDDVCADLANARAITSLVDKEPVDGCTITLVAQDHRSSVRGLFHRVSRPWIKIPSMAAHVESMTADTLTLKNNLRLCALPCRPAATRGARNLLAVMNEAAYYHAADGRSVAGAMRTALLPTLATTGGKLVIVSSPYMATDLLGDLHKRHWAQDLSPTLVVQASAPEMNPTLPADYLQRMERDDPQSYASEVLRLFRAGVGLLFDDVALDSCVGEHRELEPVPGVHYTCGVDLSGGRVDGAALSICMVEGGQPTTPPPPEYECIEIHGVICKREIAPPVVERSEPKRVVGVLTRVWPAPHNPETVIAEMATLARSYNCDSVVGDRYAAGFAVANFYRHGIRYRPTLVDASTAFLELLPKVNSGGVMLPNHPQLLREARGLERKTGFAGRDHCGHHVGGHDDAIASYAVAAYHATRSRPSGVVRLVGW